MYPMKERRYKKYAECNKCVESHFAYHRNSATRLHVVQRMRKAMHSEAPLQLLQFVANKMEGLLDSRRTLAICHAIKSFIGIVFSLLH